MSDQLPIWPWFAMLALIFLQHGVAADYKSQRDAQEMRAHYLEVELETLSTHCLAAQRQRTESEAKPPQ